MFNEYLNDPLLPATLFASLVFFLSQLNRYMAASKKSRNTQLEVGTDSMEAEEPTILGSGSIRLLTKPTSYSAEGELLALKRYAETIQQAEKKAIIITDLEFIDLETMDLEEFLLSKEKYFFKSPIYSDLTEFIDCIPHSFSSDVFTQMDFDSFYKLGKLINSYEVVYFYIPQDKAYIWKQIIQAAAILHKPIKAQKVLQGASYIPQAEVENYEAI